MYNHTYIKHHDIARKNSKQPE